VIKECKGCGALIAAGTHTCPHCGANVAPREKEKKAIEVLLERLTPSEIQRRKWNVYELEQVRQARGYKVGWVLNRLETYRDFEDYARLKGYADGWVYYNHNRYKDAKK
jgi:uncharacterized Zn finger protein (UPF0148 family)